MSAEGVAPGAVEAEAEAEVVVAAAPPSAAEPGAPEPEPAVVASTVGDTTTTLDGEGEDDEKDAVAKEDVALAVTITNEYDKVSFADETENFLMMASLKAPYFRAEDRAPIDLIAVVDESGSMSGERIELVKQTVDFIIDNLESNDRFGIVGYHTNIRDALDLTKMTTDGKKMAHDAVKTLRARGSTALCGGLVRGVQLMRARKPAARNDVSSVMLFTDGEATDGPTTSRGIIAALRDVAAGKKVDADSISDPVAERSRGIFKRKKKSKKKKSMPLPTPPKSATAAEASAVKKTTAGGSTDAVVGESGEVDLSCVVNTFGFGAGHKAALLQDIADFGRGMYAFIENGEQISDTFAECLGGLVSTVAQNIKITVEPLSAGVAIGELLSKGFTMKKDDSGKVEIEMKDIQSEEKRDLLFYMKLPALSAPSAEWPLAKMTVAYSNCVRELDEVRDAIAVLERCGDDVAIGERNYELDLQLNRILAAKAMDSADRLAEAGRLEEARTALTTAEKQIVGSKSAASDYSQKLVKEMQSARSGLRDARMYATTGSKVLKMSSKAHYQQRAVTSSAFASQDAYSSRSKAGMKRKFKKPSRTS